MNVAKTKKTIQLHFDSCFDPAKLAEIAPLLPATYGAMNSMAPFRKGKWPTQIHCMSHSKIIAGRKRGAGHGYTYPGEDGIWINPTMTVAGHWLVFVHENFHHAWPDATEEEINCRLVPQAYQMVFGKKLNPEWARSQGLGSPVPGVGDRSFCR